MLEGELVKGRFEGFEFKVLIFMEVGVKEGLLEFEGVEFTGEKGIIVKKLLGELVKSCHDGAL